MNLRAAALGWLLSGCVIATPTAAPANDTPATAGAASVPEAAQQAAGTLMLEDVLGSSARHAPQIIEALARIRQAEGRLTTATGAFDTVFEADSQSRLLGYYDGQTAEVKATRPFTDNGGGLYGGYRISRGEFGPYDGKSYTNLAGELKLGGIFALMRDRAIDERRGRVSLAEADIDIARLEREMVAIGVQRRAIAAYQAWVAAGMRVKAYRELLALAEDRQEGIVRQVRLGARPAILATENEQNILRRRTLLVRSEQELAVAANDLSFYWRDDNGERRVPADTMLPASFPTLAIPPLPANGRPAFERPDLDMVVARIEQNEMRLKLAENELKPRLDVRGELAQPLGEPGLGGVQRSGTDIMVGLKFSVPLERRAARGRIAEAQAEKDALTARRQTIEDQIMVEVNGLAIAVRAADRLAGLAAGERDLADQMATAERRRFALGASDFLIVNLREEAATDARLRQLDAEFRRAAARAELVAATADRAQLGLAPTP